jgi:hypothetical protein
MASIKNLIKDAGKNLSAKEVKQIAEKTGYTAQSIVNRAEKADVKVQPSAASFVQQAVKAQTAAQEQRATAAAPANTTPSFNYTPQGSVASVTYNPVTPKQEIVSPIEPVTAPTTQTASLTEVESANRLAAAQIEKQIAQLQDFGQTERLKYEVDNRIPVVQAEAKGKLDLQKIVNSGYKEISQIERASKMMGNITSMFNF